MEEKEQRRIGSAQKVIIDNFVGQRGLIEKKRKKTCLLVKFPLYKCIHDTLKSIHSYKILAFSPKNMLTNCNNNNKKTPLNCKLVIFRCSCLTKR